MKMCAAMRANHPLKGVHPSIETIEKIRQSNLGQKRTASTCENISNGLKQYWKRRKNNRHEFLYAKNL